MNENACVLAYIVFESNNKNPDKEFDCLYLSLEIEKLFMLSWVIFA